MKMKQSYSSFSMGPIITTILMILFITATVLTYFQLRSFDSRMAKLEPQVVESMQTTQQIVELINTSMQAQQK